MEETIKIGPWNINYLKVGMGPHTVLLMPGGLGSIWTNFRPQVEGLNREKFTIVAWDPPGYGKSRPPEKEYTIESYEKDAEFLFEFTKALQIPEYSIVSLCEGGSVSIIHAARYPEKVKKLVLISTRACITQNDMEVYDRIKDIDSWSPKMFELTLGLYGEALLRKMWTSKWEVITEIYKRGGDICCGQLENIRCPTLIVYGGKDPAMDSRFQSALLHRNIQGSRILCYPEGKHLVHLKYSEDFNKKVEEFLLQSEIMTKPE